MKISWKTIGTLAIGMAFILGIQQIPFQKILNAQAQTVRMLKGPDDNPFNSSFLTPVSSNPNSNMPSYALPDFSLATIFSGTNILAGPVQIDINADGLLDFVFSQITNSGSNSYKKQYIIINTGDGYNLLYVCQKDREYISSSYVTTYKGDCAAQ